MIINTLSSMWKRLYKMLWADFTEEYSNNIRGMKHFHQNELFHDWLRANYKMMPVIDMHERWMDVNIPDDVYVMLMLRLPEKVVIID